MVPGSPSHPSRPPPSPGLGRLSAPNLFWGMVDSFKFTCTGYTCSTCCSIPSWEIPWTEDLADYRPWGHKKLDMT